MKKEIVLLELFSGIGGFTKGFIDAGYKIKKHYFSEIDKHAIANYKYNFKNAEYVGSVTDVSGGGIERPDVITFGSPCQDFSLAGKRTGLDGKRSVLILEAIRIITEYKPSVFIWENVKGTFSSNNGADFWAIIAAFANIGGYRLEWQLLNTSWFLPQNRERIYLVGHLAGASEPGVFPFRENDILASKTFVEKRNRNEVANTLSSAEYKLNLETNYVRVNSATSQGYELATEGDSINLSVPTSKTRRGRVGKGKAQTLDTQCNQGIIVLGNLKGEGGHNVNNIHSDQGIAPTVRENHGKITPVYTNALIRRLTEIECERLQGFPDDWTKYGIYEKQVWTNKKLKTFEIVEKLHEIPKTQRYKMCGNAVTTNVVRAIAERLKIY